MCGWMDLPKNARFIQRHLIDKRKSLQFYCLSISLAPDFGVNSMNIWLDALLRARHWCRHSATPFSTSHIDAKFP